jgi:hypothetical protein
MDLLPVRTVPLASDLPPARLVEVLRGAIGEGLRAHFAGSVRSDRFAIVRMNEFRSTFMPLLRGSLAPAPGGGTRVRLRLSPPHTVVVFMVMWLGFLAAAAAMIVAAHARDAGRSLLWLLAPAGLAALSWYVMASVFAADARWAVEHLLERVQALCPECPPHGDAPESAGRGSAACAPRCERRN